MKHELLERIDAIHGQFPKQVLARNAALRDNREFSLAKLTALRQAFAGSDVVASSGLATVAVAGSFGRLDACQESDLDDMPIAEKSGSGGKRSKRFDDWLESECAQHGVKRPNPDGIFRDIVTRAQVLKFAGDMAERYQDFSRRVLLLLEATWLYEEAQFEALRNSIIDQYSMDVKADPRKNFVFLLNDTIRYFRTICVNYQYTKEETQRGKWPLRNMKLRHSRVLMYFSMIACIGAVSRYHGEDKVAVLTRLIQLDPIARLHVVYELCDDSAFFRVGQYYNAFLAILNQADARAELIGLDYAQRYSSPVFAALKANSDGLSSELLRFFRARTGDWDERFFEYMIF